MSTLPTRFAPVIVPFGVLFRQPTWRHARALLLGAILAPGVRTVASVLRVLGLARERRFCRYHRVLSRAAWSPRAASRILLGLLVRAFAPTGPLVFGIDDTIERRRGQRIRAKGIYRDPTRSSHSHFVKASGLRWCVFRRCRSVVSVEGDHAVRSKPIRRFARSRSPRSGLRRRVSRDG